MLQIFILKSERMKVIQYIFYLYEEGRNDV